MEKETAKIYELPQATLQNVANVLREIANEIDAGSFGNIHMAAIVLEEDTGAIRTFGGGGADYYRAMSMFNLGIANLVARRGSD
jgi:hypothetical protein